MPPQQGTVGVRFLLQSFVGLLIGSLSFHAYRSGLIKTMQNILLPTPDLPAAYFSHGDASTHCSTFDSPPQGFTFCEDATFWDFFNKKGKLQDRKVIFSCDPNRKQWNTVMGPLREPEGKGALWVLSTDKTPRAIPQQIKFEGYPENHDFHPLGIEVYPSHAGNTSNIFAVNHGRLMTTIEQFTISPKTPTTAQWVRTLSSPHFVSPNGLALTSPSSFYVTNDHKLTRRIPYLGHILPIAETILGLPLGWLSHITIDEKTGKLNHTVSIPNIPFANGVALSHDGKTLAVVSTSSARVFIYERDNSGLKLVSAVHLPFAPDNISIDDNGVILVAGHPDFPALIKVAKSAEVMTAPSWVASITKSQILPADVYDVRAPVSASRKVPAVSGYSVETVFQSNGQVLSSSTTGLRDARTGTVYIPGLYEERGAIVCTP